MSQAAPVSIHARRRCGFARLAALLLSILAAAPAATRAEDAPAAEPSESDFLTRVRQLTYEGKRAGEGYFSPDGKQLVFQSEREPGNPFYQIYLLDMESGDVNRVSPGLGKTTCSFIQPGTGRVIFASTHMDEASEQLQKDELEMRASGKQRRYAWDYDEHFDIFSASPDGGDAKRLTNAQGYDAEGSCSPDGKLIVFSSNRHAYLEPLSEDDAAKFEFDKAYFAEIYLMNADGSDQRRLTTTPGYDGGPFFTPDGERIIWRRFDDTGLNADVYTMAIDGSDVRRLTDFKAMSWAPYMHPSNEYAIFATNKQGFDNFELYIVDADGKREPVRVTYTAGFDGLPVFSPDGATLAWTSTRQGGEGAGGQLFLGKWNHEAARAAIAASPLRPVSENSVLGSGGETHQAVAVMEPPAAASTDESLEDLVKRSVYTLASDEFEGRLTGSEGEAKASEFLVSEMKKYGAQPFDRDGDWLEPFEFNTGVSLGEGNAMAVEILGPPADPMGHHAPATSRPAPKDFEPTRTEGEVDKTFAPFSYSSNGEFEGDVVFAGYGISIQGDQPYDSFEGLNLEGKWALVLRYSPEDAARERRRQLRRGASLVVKAREAKKRGAKGIMIVDGPNSRDTGGQLIKTRDGGSADEGIIALHVKPEIAEALLAQAGSTLKDAQDALDTGRPVAGYAIPNAKVYAKVALDRGVGVGHNVVAVLPPPGGVTAETTFYAIGGHYDHLGRGLPGQSLARRSEEGQIHNGADDNASGASAVLGAGRQLAMRDRSEWKHGVLLLYWSGEEMGLLGSAAFLADPPIAKERILGYVNMDMVGRDDENKLLVEAAGSSSAWPGLIEKANVSSGFDVKLGDDPFLPTDSITFYNHQIPSLALWTGVHDDYHRPTDDADKVDFHMVAGVSGVAARIVRDLARRAEPIDYVRVAPSPRNLQMRSGARVSLGTIPDYGSGTEGVKIGGSRPGSAAEKAGLQPGDVVVGLAGEDVKNIYDYTYIIENLKPDEEVEIIVVRQDERLTLKITPQAR